MPVKRRFKVRVITQPMPTNLTLPMNPTLPAEPTPTVVTSTARTQMPVAKSAAMTIPVTVYNLAQGKFKEIHYSTRKFQEGEGSPPPAVTISRSSNLKLQLLPQPHRTERTPHGLIPYQHPPTYLNLGHLGQFPQWKLPQLSRWKRQKGRPPPRVAAIPHANGEQATPRQGRRKV